MISKAFTVFDSKTEAYLRPFFCLSTGEAIRSFSDAVNDSSSMFFRHPADFHLFEIGTFEDQTAELEGERLTNLGCALTFKIEASNDG